MSHPVVFFRNAQLSKLNVFYREAGDPAKPAVLLLHGFPTSSHMFRNLVPALAENAYVIAPDLPGYGNTESPIDGSFKYTFDTLAEVIAELVETHLGLKKYFIYVMDYGAPVGFRLTIAHPERVLGFIVQSGNAYEEGFTEIWEGIRQYWKDRSPENEKLVTPMLTLDFTKLQYTSGAGDVFKVSPDCWHHDYYFLQQPGHREIQLDLLYDYQSNLPLYPVLHELFRKHRFPTLIVWGENDFIFGADGARAYLRDLPDAELHLLHGGHFALEEHLEEIANHINRFVKATSSSP